MIEGLKDALATRREPKKASKSHRLALATSPDDSLNLDELPPEAFRRNDDGSSARPSDGEPGAFFSNSMFEQKEGSEQSTSLPRVCTMSVEERLKLWASRDLWLSIRLVEAKHLGVFNSESLSSDPWARMRLLSSHKSPLSRERAVLPAAEYRTRTCHRNLSPMIQEALIVPLGKETNHKTVFNLMLYDADFLADSFMGQLNVPLEQLLYSCYGKPLQQWYALRAPVKSYSYSTQEGLGEVLLQVEVLSANEATLAKHAQEDFKIPEFLHAKYTHNHLQVGLKQLAISCHGRNTLDGVLKDLAIKVRIGMAIVSLPIKTQTRKKSRDGLELMLQLDDKVSIPLTEAFVGSFRGWKNKAAAEVADIFVYLVSGSLQLCKTQVPIWVVPQCAEGSLPEDNEPHQVFREMQLYTTKPLMSACAIGLDISLLPSRVAEAKNEEVDAENGSGIIGDGFEDEQDAADAGPLSDVPAPLETSVLERAFNCGPCKLYQLLLKSDSTICAQVAVSEGLTRLEWGDWKATEKGSRQRTVTYTKPLSIPVPFAPKQADVTEVHTLSVKGTSGWVLEVVITTDAPKGDIFRVVSQVVGQRGPGPQSSSLRVTMMVDFVKAPGLLKSAISGGATRDTTTHWQAMAQGLEAHLQSAGAEGGGSTAPLPPAAPLPSVSAAVSVSKPMQVYPMLSLLGLLLFALVLLAALLRGTRELRSHTQRLTTSLDRLRLAQQQLALHAGSFAADGPAQCAAKCWRAKVAALDAQLQQEHVLGGGALSEEVLRREMQEVSIPGEGGVGGQGGQGWTSQGKQVQETKVAEGRLEAHDALRV